MKHPDTRPQEKDIRLTMTGIFRVANKKEQATNARQRNLVSIIWASGLVSFFLTAGIRSTATAEAEVRTTASSVDMDAESSRIIITARRMMPRVPLPSTSISIAGMTESKPPSGSCPPSTSLEVLPMRYAPQPIMMQKVVEMIVPRLMEAADLSQKQMDFQKSESLSQLCKGK